MFPSPILNQSGFSTWPPIYQMNPASFGAMPYYAYQSAATPSALPSPAPIANSTYDNQIRQAIRDGGATDRMLGIPARTHGFATVATKVLWLLNLPNDCAEHDIRAIIAPLAEVVAIEINDFRNYCFVTVSSRVDCFKVIRTLANDCWINGNKVNVCYAKAPGMDKFRFKDLWNGKKGVIIVPWDLLPRDILQLSVGTYVDEGSLPEYLRNVVAASINTTTEPQGPHIRCNELPLEVVSPTYRGLPQRQLPLKVRCPVYAGSPRTHLPLEVSSPAYGGSPQRQLPLEVSSPVYGVSPQRQLPLEVSSPVYGGSPRTHLPLEVSSPVYGGSSQRQLPLEVNSPVYGVSPQRQLPLEVSSPVYSRHIEVLQVSSPVYSNTTVASVHRNPNRSKANTTRNNGRSRSRSPFAATSRRSSATHRALRPIENNRSFGRISNDGRERITFPKKVTQADRSRRVLSPPPLRDVDKSIFEVYSREVTFCSSAILDNSIALRAPRGRGNAMAFACNAKT